MDFACWAGQSFGIGFGALWTLDLLVLQHWAGWSLSFGLGGPWVLGWLVFRYWVGWSLNYEFLCIYTSFINILQGSWALDWGRSLYFGLSLPWTLGLVVLGHWAGLCQGLLSSLTTEPNAQGLPSPSRVQVKNVFNTPLTLVWIEIFVKMEVSHELQ